VFELIIVAFVIAHFSATPYIMYSVSKYINLGCKILSTKPESRRSIEIRQN